MFFKIASCEPVGEELIRLGANSKLELRAVKIGEKRKVRKGDWYLSGAIPEAYRAFADADDVRDILRIVRVAPVEAYVVIAE